MFYIDFDMFCIRDLQTACEAAQKMSFLVKIFMGVWIDDHIRYRWSMKQ